MEKPRKEILNFWYAALEGAQASFPGYCRENVVAALMIAATGGASQDLRNKNSDMLSLFQGIYAAFIKSEGK